VMCAAGAVALIGADVNARLFQSSALHATVNDQLNFRSSRSRPAGHRMCGITSG
jgi:hypothetical protein